jgi:lipoate-protein ligase A
MPEPVERAVHVLDVDRPALVLGSAQADDVVDRDLCARSGVEVVRRRSGGGAVLLEPGAVVWVDVELPRGDPLWDDDVARASWWLGERWATALAGLGVTDPTVHRDRLVAPRWSAIACFAGLGPGEVTAGPGGPKVLGVSQRRTRGGARFQCAVPLRWSPAALGALLRLQGRDLLELLLFLEEHVRPVEGRSADEVVAAFVSSLDAA